MFTEVVVTRFIMTVLPEVLVLMSVGLLYTYSTLHLNGLLDEHS